MNVQRAHAAPHNIRSGFWGDAGHGLRVVERVEPIPADLRAQAVVAVPNKVRLPPLPAVVRDSYRLRRHHPLRPHRGPHLPGLFVAVSAAAWDRPRSLPHPALNVFKTVEAKSLRHDFVVPRIRTSPPSTSPPPRNTIETLHA